MNRQYLEIAGITICFESELDSKQFNPALVPFLIDTPGDDVVTLQRFFGIPELKTYDLGSLIFKKRPWAIFENRQTGHSYYQGIMADDDDKSLWCFADFSHNYNSGKIYSPESLRQWTLTEGWKNLTGFPSDSLWLAHLLSDRSGILMHSAAAILNGKGLLFIGRSEAGKTTTTRMLQQARNEDDASVSILCDESNILRKWNDGWRVHGTWGHGEEPEVSSSSAFLTGIFVLKQDKVNCIDLIRDRREKLSILLSTIFRPVMTEYWWKRELTILDQLLTEIPVYQMRFDKSGQIVHELEKLTM